MCAYSRPNRPGTYKEGNGSRRRNSCRWWHRSVCLCFLKTVVEIVEVGIFTTLLEIIKIIPKVIVIVIVIVVVVMVNTIVCLLLSRAVS